METTTSKTKTKWSVDPAHTEIHFKVKHLVISTVTGAFKSFNGHASFNGDDLSGPEISFNIDPNSIDTNQAQRDGHLKSGDFFDIANHPEINFHSTSLTKIKDDQYKLNGNLTMRGITNPIELAAEFGGIAKDGYGNVKMGFEVTGIVHRKDFGMNWNAAIEAGGLTLGEDIKLIANVQLVKQAGE